MFHVGLDIHSKHISICALSAAAVCKFFGYACHFFLGDVAIIAIECLTRDDLAVSPEQAMADLGVISQGCPG
jgi:hypothetical protein